MVGLTLQYIASLYHDTYVDNGYVFMVLFNAKQSYEKLISGEKKISMNQHLEDKCLKKAD